jgi:hypothetical protein
MSLFKNERQEVKTDPVWELAPLWRGKIQERVKESEYGGNMMYSCLKIEKWDLLKLFQELGEGGMKKNDGGENLTKIYCKHFYKCHNAPW